jgi:small conductance mechanosensitive channel
MEASAMDINATIAAYGPRLADWSVRLVFALAILIVGWTLAGWTGRGVRRLLNRSDRIDPTVASFVASLIRYSILVLTLVIVLAKVGFETTSLVALLGAMGLAVGLALQGTLSDVAAGVVLLVVRPFRVGDVVEIAATQGEVKSVALVTTEIATGDNRKIVIPNSKVWGQPIQNLTSYGTRRIDIPLTLEACPNPSATLALLKASLQKDPDVLAEPAPFAVVDSLTGGINIIVSAWVSATDAGKVKPRLVEAVYATVLKEGLSLVAPAKPRAGA